MKKLHYKEENGEILGYYDTNLHKNIPAPNIEITQEEWQEAIDNNYNHIDLSTFIFSVKDYRTEAEIKEDRYKALEEIFSEKWLGIQKLIIDKPYMTNPKTIQAQIDSYKELAIVANEKLKQDPNNAMLQAIVDRYNNAKDMQFNVNALMQTIRGVLEDKIEQNDTNVDNLLEVAKNIKLTKDDLTEQKLNEIKGLFI